MKTDQSCKTVLIEDLPAAEDAFSTDDELGPHARVANAIVETLGSEDGGKVIGLEGTWGAGKSTVVNLVTAGLTSRAGVMCITFDAWAHEGDPLRRTFLETLVSSFRQRKWVQEELWKKKLDLLANRRKSVQTRSTKKLTMLGVLIAFAIMLVPIGTALASDALRDYSITIDRSKEVAWQFIIGLILALSPLVVSFFYAFSLLLSRPFSWRKPFVLSELLDISNWSFLDGKSDVEIVSDSVETPNPTSLEFGQMFRELVHEALQGSDRRLLLIIDNLDRADTADALRIWSTLQIFLQDTQSRSQDWFRRLWVLVPYDPDGLRKLWEAGNPEPEWSTDLDGVIQRRSAAFQPGVAESFFEKSFQVRFQVPPLIISGWKTLLFRLLGTALPNHRDDDRHKIYRVIDLFRGDRIATPTPRQLKVMVNQIGAVHRQWEHAFPIDHITYFVLQGIPRRELVAGLRASSIPTQDAIRLLGPELRASMAGLAFNVPAKRGMELLLGQNIYSILTNKDGDPKELVDLADEHGSGFWQTLEQVADERFTDLAPSTLAKIAESFESTRLLERSGYVETGNIIKAVRSSAEKISEWTPFDSKVGSGLAALVKVIRNTDFAANLVQAVSRTVASFEANAGTATGTGANLVRVHLQLFDALRITESQELMPQRITLPLSAQEWMSACVILADQDAGRVYWRRFAPSCGSDAVVNQMIATINDGRFGEAAVNAYRITSEVAPAQSWETTYAPLRARLDAGINAPSQEVRWLLFAYMGMKKEGKPQVRPFEELFNNGHVLHHFYNASQSKNHECQAVCAFGQLKRFPANQRPTGMSGHAEAGHQAMERLLAESNTEFANAFLSVLFQQSELPLLLLVLDARGKADSLILGCLRMSADQPYGETIFSAETIRQRWPFLLPNLNSEDDNNRFSRVLLRALEHSGLAQAIMQSVEGFRLNDIPLYSQIVLIQESPAASHFAKWCSERVAERSIDDWTADLKDRFVLTAFALSLVERGAPPSLSIAFRDALEQHAASLCAGAHVPPPALTAKWPKLLSCISETALRSSLKVALVRVAAEKARESLSGSFFDVYSDELRGFEKLPAILEPAARLLIGLVRRRGPESGLKWGASVLESEQTLRTDPQTSLMLDELRTRVREAAAQDVDDVARPLILEIGEALGIAP